MTDPAFWAVVTVAVMSWSAVVCRWMLRWTGIGERFAVWRWRRQDRVGRT